jgi:hypothetical protein
MYGTTGMEAFSEETNCHLSLQIEEMEEETPNLDSGKLYLLMMTVCFSETLIINH